MLANVAAWSVQVGVLALVAGALARLLPVDRPGARLARFAVSDRVGTPASFGLGRPLILLPPGFESAERARQAQVALHELLHVRRGDWLPC